MACAVCGAKRVRRSAGRSRTVQAKVVENPTPEQVSTAVPVQVVKEPEKAKVRPRFKNGRYVVYRKK